ncbi:MAG: hypothetical protein HY875_02860 [Chloroflexi bacterium]|nr:hypothetical protein [Chloroflexota bacterium]
MERPAGDVPLEIVQVRMRQPSPPPIGMRWLFAAAMAVSLLVAAFGGLLLGVLAAFEMGPAADNWSRVVQAHGHLQLFGWVAVFVGALAMEFIFRLNQRTALPASVRLAAVTGLAAGGIAGALGQLAGWEWLWVAGTIVGLGGALVLAGAIFSVRPARPWNDDPHWLFFRAAMSWLVVAAIVSVAAALRATDGVARLDDAQAANELMVRGFVTLMIVGVGLRAFPGHLGTGPANTKATLVSFALMNGGLVAWSLGSGAVEMPEAWGLRLAGDLAHAAGFVTVAVALGIPRVFGRILRGELFVTLVGLSWVGAGAYVVLLVGQAISSPATDPGLYAAGATRHAFLAGFMAPLMLAMAHIVLARFGTGRVALGKVLTAAFGLVMIAWPLRVGAALANDAPGTAAKAVLGGAGVATMAAFGLAAVVCAVNARAIFEAQRRA